MTRKCLNDEQRGKLWTRFGAIVEKVEKEALPYNSVMDALQLIFDGDIPAPLFKRDMRKEAGWTLEKEGPGHPAGVTKPGDLKLVTFLNYGEQSVTGTELEQRASELGVLGQHTAEWLLDHQYEIPAEWRRYYLVFLDSVWQSSDGNRYVPCLYWGGGRWYLDFDWLAYGFDSFVRLVQPRK